MKKLISISSFLFLFVLMLILASCGGMNQNPTTTPGGATTSTNPNSGTLPATTTDLPTSSKSDLTFKVIFQLDSKNVLERQDVKEGQLAIKPTDPEREGLVFGGWFTSSNFTEEFDFNTPITSDITLYAFFGVKIVSCTVEFETYDGSRVNKVSVNQNNRLTQPKNPTKEGFIFDGWYKDENFVNKWNFQSDIVLSDMTLYAKWAEAVNVYFESNGGNGIATETIKKGSTLTLTVFSNPTKEGCEFLGWYIDQELNTLWDSTQVINESFTLYAKWIEIFTVTFEANGGSSIDPITVRSGSTITKPANPQKEGYDFNNWYKDEDLSILWDNNEKITQSITLYAKWDIKSFDVTFNSKGGSLVSGVSVDYNNEITKPTDPTKDGYEFGGWYSDNNLTKAWDFDQDKVKSNMTLYAKWNVKEYNVTLHYNTLLENGKEMVETVKTVYGYLKVDNPEKEGFIFNGWWYLNGFTNGEAILGETFNLNTKITTDLELYAEWKEKAKLENQLEAPTIKYDDNGDITWDSISNASGYELVIKMRDTGSTEYTVVSTKTFNSSTKTYRFDNTFASDMYQLCLKAKGDGTNYVDSEYSLKYYPYKCLTDVRGITYLKDEGILKWDKVPNAEKYKIKVTNPYQGYEHYINDITENSVEFELPAGSSTVIVTALKTNWKESAGTFTYDGLKLSKPINIEIREKYPNSPTHELTWSVVLHANSYTVYVNGKRYGWTDLCSMNINVESDCFVKGLNEITIIAADTESNYLESNAGLIEFERPYYVHIVTKYENDTESISKKVYDDFEYRKVGYKIIKVNGDILDTPLDKLVIDCSIKEYEIIVDLKDKTDYSDTILDIDHTKAFYWYLTLKDNTVNKPIDELFIPEYINMINILRSPIENLYYDGDLESWINISKNSNPVIKNLYLRDENGDKEYNGKKFKLLEEVVTPEGMEIIDSIKAESIKKIIISDDVKIIGNTAFSGCINLREIVIGKNVTEIGSNAFKDTGKASMVYNLSSLDIRTESYGLTAYKVFKSLDEVANIVMIDDDFMFDGDTLIGYFGTETEVVLPDGGFTIDGNVILKYKLARVFKGNTDIVSVTMSNDIISMDNQCFDNCTNLSKLVLSNSLENVLGGFSYCTSLKELIIPEGVKILSGALFDHVKLDSLVIPKSIKELGNYNTAWGTITDLYYNGTIEDWFKIDLVGTPLYSSENFYISDENGDVTFKENNYKLLTEVTIPNTYTKIKQYYLSGIKRLVTVNIPNSVKEIDYEAFAYCYNLKNIVLPDGLEKIGDRAFEMCVNLYRINIPASVKTMNFAKAFDNCSNLLEVYNLSTLSVTATFIHTSMDERSNIYTDDNGFMFATIDNENYLVGYSGDEENITLPSTYMFNTITYDSYKIRTRAFSYNYKIKKVIIPVSVKEIKVKAFLECTNLEYMEIPFVGTQYYTITDTTLSKFDYIFEDNYGSRKAPKSLKTVKVYNISILQKGAFDGNESLVTIILPDELFYIGYGAFSHMTRITTIYTPFIGGELVEVTSGGKTKTYEYIKDNTLSDDEYGLSYAFGQSGRPSSLGKIVVTSVKRIMGANLSLTNEQACKYIDAANIQNLNGPKLFMGEGLEGMPKNSILGSVYNLSNVYMYQATEPTDDGNYWHYGDDGITPVIWPKNQA